MPLTPEPRGAARGHLGIMLRAVCDIIAESGDGTPVMVGEHYVNHPRSIGSPPCVVLVPEPGWGKCKIEKAYELGQPGKQVHACDVVVRAAEGIDDIARLDNAYDLSDKVYDAVERAGAGFLVPGDARGDYPSPFGVDTGAGVQLCWGFTYERDIRGNDAVRRARPAPPDDEPDRPLSPPGETGTLDTITGSTTVAPEDDNA